MVTYIVAEKVKKRNLKDFLWESGHFLLSLGEKVVSIVSGFTLILTAFMVVLYIFLFIVQKELVFHSQRKWWSYLLIILLAVGSFYYTLVDQSDLDEAIRGGIAGLLILSFLIDGKGLTEDRISVNAMDKRGIPYEEVDRIVLLKTQKKVKMNFFRRGMRGPLLVFRQPLEEIVAFLSTRLKEGTPIDILIEESGDEQ